MRFNIFNNKNAWRQRKFHKVYTKFSNKWFSNVFIWEENILPFLKDYTIILKQIVIAWEVCYIWLIWSLKMNYSFNISAVNGIIK